MNMIKQMKYYCKYKDQGCSATMKGKDIFKHEFECEYGRGRASMIVHGRF